MKSKMIILSMIAAFVVASETNAQESQSQPQPPQLAIKGTAYKTAIGLRGGGTSGLTIKHFVNDYNALEGILGVWQQGLSATLLFEHYIPAYNVAGLNWYYGGGGHASFGTGETVYFEREGRYRVPEDGWGLGIDVIFGIEYKVPNIPFAFSFDLKPFAEYNSRNEIWLSIDPGLGAKVTF